MRASKISLMILVAQVVALGFAYLFTQLSFSPLRLMWMVRGFFVLGAVWALMMMVRRTSIKNGVEGFLLIGIIFGLFFLPILTLPFFLALVASAIILLSLFLIRGMWWHDLLFLIGLSGLGLMLSSVLPFSVMIVGLVLIVVYDMVSAPQAGLSDDWRIALASYGLFPVLFIPSSFRDVWRSIDTMSKDRLPVLCASQLCLFVALLIKAWNLGSLPVLLMLMGSAVATITLRLMMGDRSRQALTLSALGTIIPFLPFFIMSHVL